jgi:hypothetical protein
MRKAPLCWRGHLRPLRVRTVWSAHEPFVGCPAWPTWLQSGSLLWIASTKTAFLVANSGRTGVFTPLGGCAIQPECPMPQPVLVALGLRFWLWG